MTEKTINDILGSNYDIITQKECSIMLNINLSTIYRWGISGKLHRYYIEGKKRWVILKREALQLKPIN